MATNLESKMDKQQWLSELAKFIVEGHTKGWAAEGAEVKPVFPGFKYIAPYKRGNWEYRDKYYGYFRAPGFEVVHFKGKPVWSMAYFGPGQSPEHMGEAKETFGFLKRALLRVTPDIPFRGPERYSEGEWEYRFQLVSGDVADFLGKEEIRKNGKLMFAQTVGGGIGIAKDSQSRPIYPWEI